MGSSKRVASEPVVGAADSAPEVVPTEAPAKKRKKSEKAEKAVEAVAAEDAAADGTMSADAFREKMQIKIVGGEVVVEDPIQTLEAAPFGNKVRAALVEAGFTVPTAVQAQTWATAVKGGDLVSVAKTGSGKTLAFLLPAFRKISKEKPDCSKGPAALVLAPTRELATQIEVVAVRYAACRGCTSTIVFGGVPKPPQAKALKAGPQLVVATPGRLMDLMNDKAVSLRNVSFLVLDEADRMLDMGFEPQMDKLMEQIPAERQTLLFSATWPKAVKKLADKYLKKGSAHINVGDTEELSANKAVSQEFYNLDDDEKERKLWMLLFGMSDDAKVIIFANTKNRINKLQKEVWNQGYECVAMHGDKTQPERDEGLAQFVAGKVGIMLATDVCARGLDIKNVTHVFNFDMARDVESYIHRIGRTGRAGASGVSITFFNNNYDIECAPALMKIAVEAGQKIPPFLEKAAEKGKNMKNKQWKY